MSAAAIAALILQYRYWILIPLTFIEGPIIGFIVGALSRLGYFNPFLAFFIFIARDMLMDLAWYLAGSHGGKTRFATWMLKKARIQEKDLHAVRILWETHGLRTMFVAKLSYGISQLFLAVAGVVRFPIRRFLKYAIIVALIEYGGLFLFGYYIGGAFGSFAKLLSNIQWAVAVLALVIGLYYVLTHFMRRKALEEEEEVE
jgi:membrane protein DedA with SNARE-associated domain